MLKQWLGCAPENFSKGRKGHQPGAIVIHAYPSLRAAEALFANPKASESCHYVVGAGGIVQQYVDESDTAYHAGLVINPTWSGYRPGINPNLQTIGIAAAVADGGAWSEELYATVAELVGEIATHWHFPSDADHIALHAEIRASKNCTGRGFDRDKLLSIMASRANKPGSQPKPAQFVHLINNANLRDGQPSTRARILRGISAGTALEVAGFTDRGERINGNASWYETPANGFVWAGATDEPNPQPAFAAPLVAPVAPQPGRPAANVSAIASGIARIDALCDGQGPAIDGNEPSADAVGAIQDLLAGHGFLGLPNIMASNYGRYGSKTAAAVQTFQTKHGLPVNGNVDTATLISLLSVSAEKPKISQVYLSRVLGMPYRGMQKILSIVAQMEGVGKFGALNLNTDKAGLSYGIIQWAQKPGRLPELLRAFSASDRDSFVDIFGDGDATLADSLIAYTGKTNGGVNPATGATLNTAFDLIAPPWNKRFERATLQLAFQAAQVETAAIAFKQSLKRIGAYAPDIVSERGIAFMLDVANQFGDGGLKKLYLEVHHTGMKEFDILDAIADESVERMPDKFQQGVRARRDGFLETARLSDQALALTTLA